MKTKRIISAVSAALLTLSLWSCSSNSRVVPEIENNNTEQVKSGQELSETAYKLTRYFDEVPFKDSDKISGGICDLKYSDNGLYLITTSGGMYETETQDLNVMSYKTDISTMTVTEEKKVDNPDPLPEYRCWVENEENDKLLENVSGLNGMYCYAELKTKSGDKYLYMSEKYKNPVICKFDSTGKHVYTTEKIPEISEGYEVIGMAETPDGNILVSAYSGIGKTIELNPEDGSVELVYEIPEMCELYGYSGDYLIYSSYNDEVLGYRYSDDSTEVIYACDDQHMLYSVETDADAVTVLVSETPKQKSNIYYTDMEGSIISSAEIETDDETWFNGICTAPSGKMYFMLYHHTLKSDEDGNYEASAYDIYSFDSDGKTEKIAETPYNRFETHICYFGADENGNIIVIRDDEDWNYISEIYSPSGELIYSETVETDGSLSADILQKNMLRIIIIIIIIMNAALC